VLKPLFELWRTAIEKNEAKLEKVLLAQQAEGVELKEMALPPFFRCLLQQIVTDGHKDKETVAHLTLAISGAEAVNAELQEKYTLLEAEHKIKCEDAGVELAAHEATITQLESEKLLGCVANEEVKKCLDQDLNDTQMDLENMTKSNQISTVALMEAELKLKNLSGENARLQDDKAFFETTVKSQVEKLKSRANVAVKENIEIQEIVKTQEEAMGQLRKELTALQEVKIKQDRMILQEQDERRELAKKIRRREKSRKKRKMFWSCSTRPR